MVNICGIKYEIVECEDTFNTDTIHFGQIEFKDAIIKINKDMNPQIKNETLCHEITHGILVHIGRSDLSDDENLVQALGNAISQTFEIKQKEDK